MLKGTINIYLMLHVLYFFNLKFLSSFGMSVTRPPHLFLKIRVHMSSYITSPLTTPPSESLDVLPLHLHYQFTVPNLIQEHVFTFFGYPTGIKGYKLYDIQNKEVFISRDVIFHEQSVPIPLCDSFRPTN